MSKRKEQKAATRVVREQLVKERRRRRTLWTAVIAVGVLVLAGLVGWAVLAQQGSSSYRTPKDATTGATGISVGKGPTTVDIYVDFLCPHCKAFEDEAGATIAKLVADGRVTVVYHPVAFLDGASTNRYSTRSSAASGCAADGSRFAEYAGALFARQPAEGGPGLTDDQLIEVGGSVGLVDPAFARCVRAGTYTSWVSHVNDGASREGVNGTPSVFVDGRRIAQPTGESITAAVSAAAK